MPGRHDLRIVYRRALEAHGYRADAAQEAAVARLEDLRQRLLAGARSSPGVLARVRALVPGGGARSPERGLYLWGGVGRGKTFLMDLFHAHAAVPSHREHFHRFMKDVHGRLRGLRDVEDPLARVAGDLASRTRVVCLDELFVGDIADAMILGGLFEGLFALGVTLVCTSNAPPRDLYRDGLQRQRFLPAIALLERHTEVVAVDAGHDYRLRQLERAPLYLSTRTDDAEARLLERFEAIAGTAGEAGGSIEIEGRAIATRRRSADVAWFDFVSICDGPRSPADYIEIARDYHTVLVSAVPRFDAALDDAARRFIALVDEFYDRGVKLVLSADVPVPELYAGERLAFEFERTKSRLAEMQTHAYLARPHRP